MLPPPKTYTNPIDDLLSVNDLAYSNIYYVEFLNSNKSNFLNGAGAESITARIEDFTIPAMLNDTHTVSYFNRDFQKVSTMYRQNKILNITFILDDYMSLLNKFSKASMLTTTSILTADSGRLNTFLKPSFLAKPIDIKLYTGFLYGNEKQDGVSYIFTEAKALGFDSGLKFTRDSVQKMTITVSFRFKEIKKEVETLNKD